MRKIIFTACLICLAGPALAERYVNVGNDRVRLLSCYNEVTVPAKYRTEKVLIEAARKVYVKRTDGTIQLVEYPATYREDKYLVEPSYKLMKPIPCK